MAEPEVKKKFNLQEAMKECFLRPTAGRCVVLRDGFTYSGRLVIPENAKRRPSTGHIVAVNANDVEEGSANRRLDWLGARVVFGIYAGTDVHFRNKPTYTILTYDEVLGEVAVEDEDLQLEDERA